MGKLGSLDFGSQVIDTTGSGKNNSFSNTSGFEDNYQDLVDSSKFFNKKYEYNTDLSPDNLFGGVDWGEVKDNEPGFGEAPFINTLQGVGNFTGNLIGGFVDSALMGLPTLLDNMAGTTALRELITFGAYDPWEKETTAGKWGRGLGEGIGIIVPFKLVGKGLTGLGKLATRGNKTLFNKMTASSMQGYTSKYLAKESGEELIGAINRIGGGSRSKLTSEAIQKSETFKKGYNTLMTEAWDIVNDKAYKKIFEGSKRYMQEATEEFANSIRKQIPRIGEKGSRDLAQSLLNEARHQSQNSLHRMTELAATKLTGGAGSTYLQQTFGAYLGDFTIGATMHLAETALHNIVVQGAAVKGNTSFEKMRRKIDPRSKALHTTEGDFGHMLAATLKSGAWMGLIGPTRFIKGGSTYGGAGLKQTVQTGLKTIMKGAVNTRFMSGKQAKFHLKMIDEASDGFLHSRDFARKLATTSIDDLSDEAAKALLNTTRKEFSREYTRFIMNEIKGDLNLFADIGSLWAGKGIQSSVPRMVAGALAMNAPGLAQQMAQDPKLWHQALGQDGHEIARNVMIGMVFSRSGRSYKTGSRSKMFETGELRDYYATNVDNLNKMRLGLELMGVKTDGLAMQQGSMMYESTRQKVRNQPFFREVHELVNEFYVDRVDPLSTPDRTAARDAFLKYLKDSGTETGSAEHNIAMEQYRIFEQVITAYDSTAPDVNLMFRTVEGKEIYDLVQSVNSISDVANARSVTSLIDASTRQAYNNANMPYKDIRKNFVLNAFEAMGIKVMPDAQGNLQIPKVDLETFSRNTSLVRTSELNSSIHELTKVIKQGKEDGWIREQGTRDPARTGENLQLFVDNFSKHKLAMLTHVYSAENVKNGAYPMGGKNASETILSNEGMREASVKIDNLMQARNVLALFTQGKMTKSETFHTLNENKRVRVMDLLNQMGFDKNPTLNLADVDVKDHQGAIDFYNKAVSLTKLLNQTGSSEKVPVTIKDVEALKEQVFEMVGDALTNDKVFRNIEAEAFDYFTERIKANQSGSENSVGNALQHLMNGNRKVDPSMNLNENTGQFVIRTPNGLLLADAELLIQKIRVLAPDKAGIIDGENLGTFYKDLQSVIEQSGNLVSFTKQTTEINRIIKSMGPDKIVELLSQAKKVSDVGLIKDLVNKTGPLENMAKLVEDVKGNLIDKKLIVPDSEDKVFTQIETLHNRTKNMTKLMQFALQNRDYTLLLHLTKQKHEFDTFFNQLNSMLEMNPEVNGTINTQWQQALVKQIQRADNFLSKDYGTLDQQNYSKYVTEQLDKHQATLSEKSEEMLVNITGSQFEGRYGVTVNSVKTILEPFRVDYNANKDPRILDNAFNALYETTRLTQNKLDPGKRRNNEEITIDVLQTVLTTMGTKEVNKVKWMGDKFVLSKDYLVNQDKHGVLAVMKNLDLIDQFYVLDKEMMVMNEQGKLVLDRAPKEGDLHVFSRNIASNSIFIDNPRARIDMQKGLLGEDFEANIKPDNYIYVPLDESIQVVIPRTVAKEAVLNAYKDGGVLSNKLQTLFQNDLNNKYLVDNLKKFRDETLLTNDAIESAILTARLIVDNPWVIKEQIHDLPTIKDVWKRLKLPEFSKGRLYTPEIIEYMDNFYSSRANDIDYFRSVSDAFNYFKNPDGTFRNMKFISLADGSSDSYFHSGARLEVLMSRYENLYGETLWSATEKADILGEHNGRAKSMVDAPTYLTKENFILHLSQIGIRREWLNIDQGRIVGFKTGAIKPKGVHVEIRDNGGITVWYDKTAFFYDAKMDMLMKSHGVDGITFESANKINKYSENASGTIRDRYINSDKATDSFGNTIFTDVEKVVNRNRNSLEIIELPMSTFNVTNVSRPHKAKAGANITVHIDVTPEVASWMDLGNKVRDFEGFLARANANEYTLTSIARELMGVKSEAGDLMLNKVPVESVLKEGGLLMDQWMGDIVTDKLFTYFFEGSKIATGEVGNSSISPMAPSLHMDYSLKDVGIRSWDVVDGHKVGRQIIIGNYETDPFHMAQQFSFNGRANTAFRGGNVKNPSEGGFFVRRMTLDINGEQKTADFSIIPIKAKKSGEQEWVISGAGYEIHSNKVVDLNVKNEQGVSREFKTDNNKVIYETTINEVNEVYTRLIDRQIRNKGLTNEDVVIWLARNFSDYHVGVMNNRQPRNQLNDIVINKITPESFTNRVKGKKVLNFKVGTSKSGGNKSEQNFTDVIDTQDADHDYDKSNSYLSAPGSFVRDVARKSGYNLKQDSYSFAEQFFAELNTRLDNSSSMAKQLSVYNNSAALRGRVVKLHNIASTIRAAFKNEPVLGKFTIDNRSYDIRLKSEAEYFNTVDNIGNWAKIFIDNYKNPVDIMNIQPIIEAILFGKEAIRPDGTKHYEGMFELVNMHNSTDRIKVIDGNYADVKRVLYQKLVKPVSNYLRFNRGMTESQAGGSAKSLRLKDIANGFETLQKDLDNPYIYDQTWKAQIGNDRVNLNLRSGMQRLSDHIIGGWGETVHAGASQNPFDIAMRTLTSVYLKSLRGKNRMKDVSEVEDLMNKAEAGVLLAREGKEHGKDYDFNRVSITDALWKYIKKDYDYIEMNKLAYRIQSLKKDKSFLENNRYKDNTEIKELNDRILELEAIKSDIELKLGGEYEYEALKAGGLKATFKVGNVPAKEYRATGDLVFWDSKGNIMLTLQKGEVNHIDIKKDWVAISNPKRFEFVTPKVQKILDAKLVAFGSLPMESNPQNKDITYLDRRDRDRTVVRIVADTEVAIRREKEHLRKGKINPEEFSTRKKALINQALNHETINTPILRKAVLWEFLKPKIDNSKVSYFEDADGRHINNVYMYENNASKSAWQLLIDIVNQESFTFNNNISKVEALNLSKEITQRQSLALLGLKNPHLDVKLDYDFGPFNKAKNRDLYIELNRKELEGEIATGRERVYDLKNGEEIRVSSREKERALTQLNDFMAGERLLTPADVFRLEQKFDLSDGWIFKTHGTDQQSIPARPKRVFGKPVENNPSTFINKLWEIKRKARKDNCRTP